jgi:hypothetical protein
MSELTQGIAQIIVLATRLRTHSEKLRDTQIKGMADDLLLQLFELQLKAEGFATEHAALKAQVQAAASPTGQRCPRCHELGWSVTNTRQDRSGRTVQTYSCRSCKLKEEVLA